MNDLLKALQMNEEGYENLVFQHWFNWCSRHATGQQEIQKLLSFRPLFDWWKSIYEDFERDFLFEAKPYEGQMSHRDAYLLYIKNVHKIQIYFSNPLIEKAKKTNIDG